MRVVGRFGDLLLSSFPEASDELNELMRAEIELWDEPGTDGGEIPPYASVQRIPGSISHSRTPWSSANG